MSKRYASRLAPMVLGTFLVLFSPVVLVAHAQNQLWLKQFGTSKSEVADALAPDSEGGVVVAGWTMGDLGGLHTGYGGDVFLSRYDSEGERLWIRQFGSREWEDESSLSPDGAGGVMIAGTTKGSLARPNNSRNSEPFLARYDKSGNQLWIRQFGTSSRDHAQALAPDGSHGVMIAGFAGDNLGGPNAGGGDAFIARFNSQGERIWLRQFGSTKRDEAHALAPDNKGGVFVTGTTQGNVVGQSAGGTDIFLARFNHGGKQLWIRQFGSRDADLPRALASDCVGGVMVAGYTQGNLGGVRSGVDAFLARYDGDGNQLWIRQFGSNRFDQAYALTPDGFGGVVVAGFTEGAMGGPNAGREDGWIARYDSAGNRLWIRQFGTGERDWAWALAADGAGDVMIAGPTQGSLSGQTTGPADVFLARYTIDSCYADCDFAASAVGSEVLDIFDFLCWQNDFVIGNSYACDCDVSTGPLVCDMFDFLCFQASFVGGCP